MHADNPLQLESLLAESFERSVSVWWEGADTLKIVITRVDDHSRIEILAVHSGETWTLSDSGMTADLLENGLDFIIEKLDDADPALTRKGREILATVDDDTLIAGITGYVSNLEFMPVLDGLWSNDENDFDDVNDFGDVNEFDDVIDFGDFADA